jgi:hypothetical protein
VTNELYELSQMELETLRWLQWRGGVCTYHLEDKQSIGGLGQLEMPGKRTMNKLVKKGLVMLTDPIGEFSPMYDITELGEEALKQNIDK